MNIEEVGAVVAISVGASQLLSRFMNPLKKAKERNEAALNGRIDAAIKGSNEAAEAADLALSKVRSIKASLESHENICGERYQRINDQVEHITEIQRANHEAVINALKPISDGLRDVQNHLISGS